MSPDELAAARRNTLNAHYTAPAYASALWAAVRALGHEGGNVLEPGCGSGNFLALASERDRAIGVELEPTTAKIAAALHPRADVRSESFATSSFAEGSFDLVIGNVPFGDFALHDPRHNPAQHRIHNHFIVKSLHLTRPGGLVAVITSRYTMDAANPAARREMAELADLVGAVRLPTGAHQRTAGTDVVTDVLILRRREPGAEPRGFAFERTAALELQGAREPLRINEYFEAHPEHVLGRLVADQGDRGRTELGVEGERDAGPSLSAALSDIVRRAQTRELTVSPRSTFDGSPAPAPVARTPHGPRLPDGYMRVTDDGFTRVEDGVAKPYRPAASQAAELRALLGLRDTAVALLEAEASTIDDNAAMGSLRQELNERYDAYLETYGPINRFTERRTGRLDPMTGEPLLARVRPKQGGFRVDPFSNVVFALEHFDAARQSAQKATLFRERVISRKVVPLGADTPEDAVAICLDTLGEVRLSEVARLLGTDEAQARTALGTLVFDEPGTARIVPAAEYLSGNVREKLREALAAASSDARFEPNVRALELIIPRDLVPEQIHARLGAAWIPASYVRQFLRETLDDPSITVEHPGGSFWAVDSSQPPSVLTSATWGTARCSAIDLAHALLEQRTVRVYDTKEDGSRAFNATETIAAAEKAKELGQRFSEWVWQDPERATQLARIYNDHFNAIVPRSYDRARLLLPGLALSFKPRPHQLAAVARILHEPAVGLFHEVGAGKTAEMVMGAMELRRLGLAKKPVVVVPNHMLDQFSREWLQLYPQAKLLAASSEDLDRESRRLFVAKCATSDWDAIVMTRSAFERIPMSPEAQEKYLRNEVDAVVSLIERAKADDARFSLKRLERMRLRTEERLKSKLSSAKDPGITFEQLGIDYVFVDEAHAYKNLRTASNIPGMSVDGSERASDLHMKLEYLREKHGRVGTLATATPIANSMGEAYTMQRYLRPDLLKSAGITDFDQWAATFGETTTAIEVAPDGSGLRMQTRFAKFQNVPELVLQWRVSADIKTGEDLQLPVPALAVRASDGQRLPETVVVPASAELQNYMVNLAERAERVRGRGVDATEDNLLRISSDGRAAGLDLRLVGHNPEAPQKIEVAAERIAALYHEHKGTVFEGPEGAPHPTPGALQLVFSDLGTPGKHGQWSVYEALRGELVARGLPRAALRFIHEARNDREKGELFAACRDGRVAVLIGSTERMGVGTNVQVRAVALHHLDCPWRPADIAQREGRILRQGNANSEVQILRYVTEGSFDGYLWQTVARKAQFIGQVMRGRLDVREIEDIGEAALSYNEVKALATGNPLLLEHAEAQAEVTRLERLERAHQNTRQTLERTVRDGTSRARHLEQRLAQADAVLAHLGGRALELDVRVGQRAYTKRSEANQALKTQLEGTLNRRGGLYAPAQLGSLHGYPIFASRGSFGDEVLISLRGVPGAEVTLEGKDLDKAALVTRLENRLAEVPNVRDRDARERTRVLTQIERAHGELGAPFRQQDDLLAARKRLAALDQLLHEAAAPTITSPVADSPEARAEEAQRRWNERLRAETLRVTERARDLQQRLGERAAALQQLLSKRAHERPEAPRSLGWFTGGQASYEAALAAWSKEHAQLNQRGRDLSRRMTALRELETAPRSGTAHKATQLAARRLARREPQLAHELAGFATLLTARREHRAAALEPALEPSQAMGR